MTIEFSPPYSRPSTFSKPNYRTDYVAVIGIDDNYPDSNLHCVIYFRKIQLRKIDVRGRFGGMVPGAWERLNEVTLAIQHHRYPIEGLLPVLDPDSKTVPVWRFVDLVAERLHQPPNLT